MHFIHDVWVNWFIGKKEGYQVCPQYEWRKEDKVELLEQIPVLYVTEQVLDAVENNIQPLPSSLLYHIHKKTTKREKYKKTTIDYAAVLTDGKGVIAFDTTGFNMPLKKSRLPLKQEIKVLQLCEKMKQIKYFHMPKTEEKESFLHVNRKYMYGLTRRERELKMLLLVAVKQLEKTKNMSELLYWLAELKDEKVSYAIHQLTEDQLYRLLYNEVKRGWSKKHEHLCKQMMKGKPFLEKYLQVKQK